MKMDLMPKLVPRFDFEHACFFFVASDFRMISDTFCWFTCLTNESMCVWACCFLYADWQADRKQCAKKDRKGIAVYKEETDEEETEAVACKETEHELNLKMSSSR